MKGCQKTPSPAHKNEHCQTFMKVNQKEFQMWPNIDDFEIYDNKTLKRIAKCYREIDKNSIGWCGTNYVDDIDNQRFHIDPERGWGFCSKDCYPDPEQPLFGRPTTKNKRAVDDNNVGGVLESGPRRPGGRRVLEDLEG